ncbi:AAA family ATPase [Marimonas arenosa]|uniref:AAA family ATPase n=1 Tax=Marimonas arenosa TaxID=1795305 RepID=A0AAE4B354_9RHOB|nr:AAA family ATPase [Marimonas arenosa]MDQ2089688.1 AAA family ATPase [Marimonas arenosa]
MTTANHSIILISNEDDITHAVGEALTDIKDVTLDVRPGTLASVNGAAVQMVDQHNLIVFKLNADTDREAVAELREQVGARGTLLALSDGSISLAEAMELKQNGIDEILPFPISREVLTKELLALSGHRTQLPALMNDEDAPRMGHVVPVMPVRGGIGATTVAINLADALQQKTGMRRKTAAHRVALVDLDIQFGTVANALDLDPSDIFFRMASEQVNLDATFISQSMQQHDSGLDILAAPDRFAPIEALDRAQVDALVGHLQRGYDYVVIDMPRTLVEWIAPILTRAARLLMVTDTTVPSIRQAHRLIEFFSQERLDLPVDMVVNHEKKPMFAARHHVEAQKVLDRPLKYWLPDDPRHARQALDRGELLSDAAGGAPLTKAIRRMSETILTETKNADAAQPKTKK